MAIGDAGNLLLKIKSVYDKSGTDQAIQSTKEFEKQFQKTEAEIRRRGTLLSQFFQEFARQQGLTGEQAAVVKKNFQDLGTALSAVGKGLSIVGSIATFATGAVAALGAAVAATAVGIFEIAKQSSDYGSRLFDAQQKTGLMANTLGALDVAARSSGSSFETVTNSVAKFQTLLGQAQAGNEKANATLKAYGVTARDTDTALQQAVKTIGDMKDESQQAAASAALFKDRTGEMIPVIRQLSGDLHGATAEADRLGLTLRNSDLVAADDFGDTLTLLTAQVKNAAAVFGLQFAPVLTDGMHRISVAMAENKDVTRAWGQNFSDVLIGVASYAKELWGVIGDLNNSISHMPAAVGYAVESLRSMANAFLWVVATGGQLLLLLEKMAMTKGSDVRGGGTVIGAQAGGVLPSIQMPGRSSGGGRSRGGGGGTAARDNSIRDAEQAANERLKVQQEKDKAQLAELKLMLEEGTITEQEEIAKRQEIEERFFDFKTGLLKKELDLIKGNSQEATRARAKIDTEITITGLQKIVQLSKDQIELEKQRAKEQANDAAIWEGIVKREIELRGQELELEQHQLEVSKQLGIASASQLGLKGLPTPDEDERTRQHLEGLKNNPIGELLKQFEGNDSAVNFINTLSDAFSTLAGAIGQAVESLVLYGKIDLRKMTAQVLASIAAQAAIKAVYELAEGLACLALSFFGDPNAGAAAGAHFAAAIQYGAVAAIAGLAGRAVAGNSFNTAAAGAGGGSSSSSQSRNTSGQGAAFSSFGDKTAISETGINRPEQVHRIILGLDPAGVLQVVHSDIDNNGKTRGMILNVATAA